MKTFTGTMALAGMLSCGLAGAASAETQFSVYSGYQTAPHSNVKVSDQADFTARWLGKSFAAPPYWGVRGIWWMEELGQPNLGLSIDYTHAKVYADGATLAKAGWSHFEFTDGLNLLTANLLYRFANENRPWTPYLGAGIGINVPHVEVTRGSGTTFDYQLGGVALQWQAGIDYRINKNWSVFTEYKGNYSRVDVKIDSGAQLKTNLMTNAVNFGVSYHF